MGADYLRKYGVQTTIDFTLYEVDGVDFRVDAVYASGDVKIMRDEGTEANTTNGFTDEGTGYSIVLTATEMQAARIVLYVVDQTATKVWLDKPIIIETYGNASAQHAADLDVAIASQVWDALLASYDTLNSFGEKINNIGTVANFFSYVIENSKTFEQYIRIMKAALAGKTTTNGTVFRDDADTKARITAVTDVNNNRTSMTLDGS